MTIGLQSREHLTTATIRDDGKRIAHAKRSTVTRLQPRERRREWYCRRAATIAGMSYHRAHAIDDRALPSRNGPYLHRALPRVAAREDRLLGAARGGADHHGHRAGPRHPGKLLSRVLRVR